MNLKFIFCPYANGHPYFQIIFHEIFNKFKLKYKEHNITYEKIIRSKITEENNCPGCWWSGNHLLLVNEDNNKTIVLTYWDLGMDLFRPELFDKYKVVQSIGGLNISLTPEEIYSQYKIKYSPYQYTLGFPNSFEHVKETREIYNPKDKIRKAVFIGSAYGSRPELINILKNNPLFDFFDKDSGYRGLSYFKKINEYRVAICLNGIGEYTLRESEIQAIGIPILRSELKMQFYNPLIPGYHYIKGSERCERSCLIYPGHSLSSIARQFSEALEKSIDDLPMLKSISDNSINYFDSYQQLDYLIDLFLKVADLELLQ